MEGRHTACDGGTRACQPPLKSCGMWTLPCLPPSQVRFESPPAAMATKPFQNEEVQHCVDYRPGRRYCVEAQANTSAPYGDKFDLFFRITILAAPESEAPGGSACFLQVVFTIQWSPSMNRMMKGMVSKAVEGGCGQGLYVVHALMVACGCLA